MGKSRKKKKAMKDLIPSTPTANISETMRKERGFEGEVFENVKTANSADSSSSSQRSLKSSRSIRRSKDKIANVKILPSQPPIQFDNDILSVYTQTQGTISLDSVSAIESGPIEELRKEHKECIEPPEKLLEAKVLTTSSVAPLKAPHVTDALFCERIHPDGPFMADHRKGDMEMDFVNQLIASVVGIDNGLPKVRFEIIPKVRLKKPTERLNQAFVQYAKFHEEMGVISDCETAISRLQQASAETSIPPDRQQRSGSRAVNGNDEGKTLMKSNST
ncbi:hypothetical protein Q1695_011852 [Nippostrongylus brasiliensis]|nr:hypothetical protein Q1695_011852 [Nippostrongylus brasiliensis]